MLVFMQLGDTSWAQLEQFFLLGPRAPQSSSHAAADALVWRHLGRADWRRRLRFTVPADHRPIVAHNLWGRLLGRRPGRVMLATRYDWPNLDRDLSPIDAGDQKAGPAGPACLTALIETLARDRDRPTVDLVFLDGQGDKFSPNAGARAFLRDLTTFERPDCVTFLGAVGGHRSMLDLDLKLSFHEPSHAYSLALFQLAHSLKLSAFTLQKQKPHRDNLGAHSLFCEAGLATALLTDSDQAAFVDLQPIENHYDPSALAQIATLIQAAIFRMTAS